MLPAVTFSIMAVGNSSHWNTVYQQTGEELVSWYRLHLELSVEWIRRVATTPDARILDAGGGASTLVDDLLRAGYRNLTVVDLSETALRKAAARLGKHGERVRWIAGDITTIELEPASVDVWHDRAVFHFLTEPDARAAYVRQLSKVVRPGGHAVMATFALDGPERCSGLEVRRYSAESLAAEMGSGFRLIEARPVEHRTPSGKTQAFVYALLQRAEGEGSPGVVVRRKLFRNVSK